MLPSFTLPPPSLKKKLAQMLLSQYTELVGYIWEWQGYIEVQIRGSTDSPTFLSLSESLSEEKWEEGERDLANRGEESISQTAFLRASCNNTLSILPYFDCALSFAS